MSNFDDIFESTPQTDEFDKEAWAAKKAAFRNYSATNALLILATKPDARRLGDKDF